MFDNPNLYVNIIYWIVGIAGILAWARFASFISHDVPNLTRQNVLMWRIMALAVLLFMLVVWVASPFGWLAIVINALAAAGVVAWYWSARVAELGPAGHLFRGAIESVEGASAAMEARKAARAVMLTYLDADDRPLPLPAPTDPAQEGLVFADQMIVSAIEHRSEGAELQPGQGGYELRFVIDGVAFPQSPMPRNVAEAAIQSIKQLAGLVVEERRRPQQGQFKVRDGEGNVTRWTVRSSGTTAGEKLIINANEQGRWELPIDQLGLNTEQLAALKNLANEPSGVVLVATPPRSGRTTTLYALLRLHDAFTNAVHTLEVNPQTEIEGATVNRFDPRGSYSKTLQSMLLKDPNIAMSAMVPDAASAELIARFARDDKRVYAGMPAFDTMAALEIWLKLVPDRALAVRSLKAIVSERLIRILCPTCKTPYQPDESTLRKLNLPVGRNLQSFKANTEGIRDQKGNRVVCPDCNSIGYRGRTGIFEVLVLTDQMRSLIKNGAGMNEIKVAARKNNMVFLVEHGIRKFAAGLTSIQEVLRVLTPEKTAPPAAGSGVMAAER